MDSKTAWPVVALVAVLLCFIFVVTYWQEIEQLAIIAMTLGGSITIAYGGFKLSARGKR